MTFREKLTIENPGELKRAEDSTCPSDYGYEENADNCPRECDGSLMTCNACWNREIPEEKEKENRPMKKTKAMLEEELEQKKAEIEDLKKELEKVEKYKQYDDAAGELKVMYDSFVNAGFNEDQAFVILMTMLQNQKAASNSWDSYLAKYLSMHRK